MRYLLVWADYMSTGLRDEYSGPISPEELGLDHELSKKFADWVNRYEGITPLDETERRHRSDDIRALDEEGLALARAVRKALREETKVSYYSEGLLKKLLVPE